MSIRHYVNSMPEHIVWGRLPCRDSEPVLRVASGDTVVFDTISHEGLVEDQGRNPVAFFARYGVKEEDVLPEAVALAASNLPHSFDNDGPHALIGPIHVEGARPGDALKIEVLALEPRVLYGVIANRQNRGALPGEFPEGKTRRENAGPDEPEGYGSEFVFASIEKTGQRWRGKITAGGDELTFPVNPFLGTMGVTPDAAERWNSIPPTRVGGNIDINELGAGATLYLPVEVAGALFYAGDPHFAQGDGEVSLTALEGSLRATLRLTVLPAGDERVPALCGGTLHAPFAETETHWIPTGVHQDLDEALKTAVREAIAFLAGQFGIERRVAYAYLSAAADFEVSQAVDRNKGVHALIRKADFQRFFDIRLAIADRELAATLLDGTAYVPARAVCEALHLPYNESADGVITVFAPAGTVTMRPDSNKYLVDDIALRLPVAPVPEDGVVLLPVRVLRKCFGVAVNWSTEGGVIRGYATTPNRL